jgi:hypothetical protein
MGKALWGDGSHAMNGMNMNSHNMGNMMGNMGGMNMGSMNMGGMNMGGMNMGGMGQMGGSMMDMMPQPEDLVELMTTSAGAMKVGQLMDSGALDDVPDDIKMEMARKFESVVNKLPDSILPQDQRLALDQAVASGGWDALKGAMKEMGQKTNDFMMNA